MNVAPALTMPISLATVRATTAAVSLALLVGMAGPSVGETPDTNPVVAVVNGTQIHQSDLTVAEAMVGRNVPEYPEKDERRESILKMMIDATLLAQIATERKLTDDPDIQSRVTFARNEGLANYLLTVVGREASTDEAVRKAYDELVAKSAKTEPEVHLREMFFAIKDPSNVEAVNAAQAKAEAALKRIRNGEAFEAVWVEVSENRAATAGGGDRGWVIRPQMGKEIADAAFSLKDGEVSPIIKTGAGLHIIKVDAHGERKQATFEQIKGSLAVMLTQKARFEVLEKARQAAKIERFDAPNGAGDKAPPRSN